MGRTASVCIWKFHVKIQILILSRTSGQRGPTDSGAPCCLSCASLTAVLMEQGRCSDTVMPQA